MHSKQLKYSVFKRKNFPYQIDEWMMNYMVVKEHISSEYMLSNELDRRYSTKYTLKHNCLHFCMEFISSGFRFQSYGLINAECFTYFHKELCLFWQDRDIVCCNLPAT